MTQFEGITDYQILRCVSGFAKEHSVDLWHPIMAMNIDIIDLDYIAEVYVSHVGPACKEGKRLIDYITEMKFLAVLAFVLL